MSVDIVLRLPCSFCVQGRCAGQTSYCLMSSRVDQKATHPGKQLPCIQLLVTPDHSHIGSDIDIAMRCAKPAAFTRPLTPGQHDSMICQIAGVRDHVGPQEMEETKRWKQRNQLLRGECRSVPQGEITSNKDADVDTWGANVALQLWPLGNYSKYDTATSAEMMFWRLRAGNASQTKGAAACNREKRLEQPVKCRGWAWSGCLSLLFVAGLHSCREHGCKNGFGDIIT